MQFWDSSALLPLVVRQGGLSTLCLQTFGTRGSRLVSFVARIECDSALQRLTREGALAATALRDGSAKLEALLAGFDTVAFSPAVERTALTLLRRQALRALDAMQLACALAVTTEVPSGVTDFVCCDRQLARAAQAEGFVLRIRLD
jgi:predicted nucleic acid-binding protein